MLKIKSDIWAIMAVTPGIMTAHYSIEYRTHFTNVHVHQVGAIGATEDLIFKQLGHIACFATAMSNSILEEKVRIDAFDYETEWRTIIVMFATISGVHYNIHNLVTAFVEAKDKGYAFCCLLPYAQFFGMLYSSSFSRFFDDQPFYFIVLNGLYLTYVTAIFNLNSTASMRFNWLFYEPLLWAAIIYADHSQLLDSKQLIYAYGLFFVQTLLKWVLFMSSVISQLTSYLDINFVTVGGKGAAAISDNTMGRGQAQKSKKH